MVIVTYFARFNKSGKTTLFPGYLEVLALRRGLINETSFEGLVTSLKPGTPYREKLRQLAFGRDA